MELQDILLLVFIILSTGFWGFMLKLATDKIGLWNAAAIGFGTAAPVTFLIFLYALLRGGQLQLNSISMGLSIAVALATIAILGIYFLLEKNYVSIVIPLIELYLVVVVLLGVFVLGEKLTITQIAGIVLAIGAVVLLSI